MKRLQCEMCGSTDILKQDGVFICQSCGARYSVAESKKKMGNDSVSTVEDKNDEQAKEISNLFLLAEHEIDEKTKLKYYRRIYEQDANNWKAWFHVALIENKIKHYLQGILKCLDGNTKADDSLFAEGIRYIIKHIIRNPEEDCSFLKKTFIRKRKKDVVIKGEELHGFEFFDRSVSYLKMIAECVDNRNNSLNSEISVEVYKLLDLYLRNLLTSPISILLERTTEIELYITEWDDIVEFFNDVEGDDLEWDEDEDYDEFHARIVSLIKKNKIAYLYELANIVNNNLQGVVDGFIPLSPLSKEKRIAILTKWITLLENYYLAPIDFSYEINSPSNPYIRYSSEKDYNRVLKDAIDERNRHYSSLYALFVICAELINYDLKRDHPELPKIRQEELQIETRHLYSNVYVATAYIINETNNDNTENNGERIQMAPAILNLSEIGDLPQPLFWILFLMVIIIIICLSLVFGS